MGGMVSKVYRRIQNFIAEDRCVILDGGVATELDRMGLQDHAISDHSLWGTWALYHEPYKVLDVHRRFAGVGCDVVSTNTWGILEGSGIGEGGPTPDGGMSHWMDVARRGIGLARQANQEVGREDDCAVAFSVNGDIDTSQRLERLQLLARVFADDPPDLVLMETMSILRDGLTLPAIEIMIRTGIPVWLSFRRCRQGLCGVHGQHWGGPEGDYFGRLASRFQRMGIGALLINCLPVEHVPGMISWLRDFTDLPLGVYPNLGRYLDPGWKPDENVEPRRFAALAGAWREEGAQIVGGCCGVTPDHIAEARKTLARTRRGRERVRPQTSPVPASKREDTVVPGPWTDADGTILFPLPFPEIVRDPGVFAPTQGSFLIWKHLFRTGAGRGKRCLDVGCGTGILSVQLALNGAEQVLAIDIQKEAIGNTMTNAFRNGVADRISGRVVDLYTYVPEERYDLVISSLYQMPVDPILQTAGHRPADFWGRNLFDHLIALLPEMLADNGVAYLMQISALSQIRTSELVSAAGMEAKAIDFSFFHFGPLFDENSDQIRRVAELSDAFHLCFGQDNVMVMYLLEIRAVGRNR
ncbi:MAG: homocysteine S-methyltransferase family protein [Gemmatimonadota bacterium]|nr:homocysteine S-methyltransferase family protein [Gemmatimonadota bacterium]